MIKLSEECDICQGHSWKDFQHQLNIENFKDDLKKEWPVIVLGIIALIMLIQ